MKISLGHSPDSDDAFMFWGLASGAVKSPHEFEHILRDIQTLNEWAMEGRLESTAISVHAFAHVADKYALLRHGGSFGEGYGPMIVARRTLSLDDLRSTIIAVPGTLTSAFLQLNIWFAEQFSSPAGGGGTASEASWGGGGSSAGTATRERTAAGPLYGVVPFDEIIPAVQAGRYDAGLIIHEGQLTYAREGLVKLADMGEWWRDRTGLPLPLGVNVVRKDLGDHVMREVSRVMRESIKAGLANRGVALQHALQYARGLDIPTSDRFVSMYVNDRTLDMGDDGIRAIQLLLEEGAKLGLVPPARVDVID